MTHMWKQWVPLCFGLRRGTLILSSDYPLPCLNCSRARNRNQNDSVVWLVAETTQTVKGAGLSHSGLDHGAQPSLPNITSALTFPCPGLRIHSDKMWLFCLEGICCCPTQNFLKNCVDNLQIISSLVPACKRTLSRIAQRSLTSKKFLVFLCYDAEGIQTEKQPEARY